MPTLVVEPDAAVAARLVERFEAMGIADVDVVEGVEAALRCIGEREYAIFALRQHAGTAAMVDLFVHVATAVNGTDQPAVLSVGGVQAALPSDVVSLDPDCGQDAFARTVRRAVAQSGARCKSRPYCHRATCPLDAPDGPSRT